MERPDFSLPSLYEALNAQRELRGLSWSAAVREMSGPFVSGMSRPMAVSTVTGLKTKAVAEGDGVLQMLRWLGRTPESFVPGATETAGTPLPDVGPGQILRFDTKRLHDALNEARVARKLTWPQLAERVNMAPSSLSHLAVGSRTGFPHVARLTRWLGVPVAQFVRVTRR
jgi:hypothetical protein